MLARASHPAFVSSPGNQASHDDLLSVRPDMLSPVSPHFLPSVLEELHGLLVVFRLLKSVERTQVPALTDPGINLPRVQAVLSRFEFANHDSVTCTSASSLFAARTDQV